MLRHLRQIGAILTVVIGVGGASEAATPSGSTRVTIAGTSFHLNGARTHPGTPIEGLLMNARMINAAFDDENASTRRNWAYPDTGVWDANRNTDEFVAAVPTYARHGLRAVTVGLQGGRPKQNATQNWHVSAFRSDGTLKPAWLDRLDRVIRACDANGVVVIVNLFYKAQSHRLDDEAAVVRAVDATTDWLLSKGYTNVLVEIANEVNDVGWAHGILSDDRVSELIARVQSRSGGRLLASTSFGGGYIPPDEVIRQSDFLLIHGNHQSASGIRSMVDKIRAKSAYKAEPKPIVFNEDSPKIENLDAAVERDASWGYHDAGANNYVDGFQSIPVNWTINTANKRAFFDRVAALAGAQAPPDPGGPPAASTSVSLSLSPDRAGAVALHGRTVRGDVYVFVPTASAIHEVRFHFDDAGATGTPFSVERSAPYDLAGTAIGGTARPYDTAQLHDGAHTLTAAIVYDDGKTELLTASFQVANSSSSATLVWEPETLAVEVAEGARTTGAAQLRTSDGVSRAYSLSDDAAWLAAAPASGSTPGNVTLSVDAAGLAPGTYAGAVTATASGSTSAALLVTLTVTPAEEGPAWVILVSSAQDRSQPLPLDGAAVAGSVYVFVAPEGAVTRVRYYLDDPGMARTPRRIENSRPWDFAGATSDGAPRPLDTRGLEDGSHVLTAAVDRPDGTTEVRSATFTVQN